MQESKEATCLLLASAIVARGVVAAGLARGVVDLEHLNLRRGLGVDVGVEDENLNPLARRGPAKHLGGSVRCRILLLAFDPLDGAASAWRRLLLAGTSSRKLDAGGHQLGACTPRMKHRWLGAASASPLCGPSWWRWLLAGIFSPANANLPSESRRYFRGPAISLEWGMGNGECRRVENMERHLYEGCVNIS